MPSPFAMCYMQRRMRPRKLLYCSALGSCGVSDINERVGQRIAAARKVARLSQADLAASLSMSRRHLSGLEHGQHSGTIETLSRIAHALGVPIAALVGEDEGPKDPKKATEPLAERLGRRATALARTAQPEDVELAEQILKVFFRGRANTKRTKPRR